MAISQINEVATLTGFSYKKMCERFSGPEKIGCNNKVTLLIR